MVTEAIQRNRILPGIPGLDQLFHRGIPVGNSILVEGGPGSGKTLLCLQLAHHHAKDGRRVLVTSFEGSEEQLRDHMLSFGSDPTPLEKKGPFNALLQALLAD